LLHHRRGARRALAGRRRFESRWNERARGIHGAATLADGAPRFRGGARDSHSDVHKRGKRARALNAGAEASSHSGLMPETLTTLPHLSTSEAI
jgi:uncharacterized protein (DUF924 family)